MTRAVATVMAALLALAARNVSAAASPGAPTPPTAKPVAATPSKSVVAPATKSVAATASKPGAATVSKPVGTTPSKPATPPVQSVRGDHVNIEGKLYSPQALFILTRREEAFDRQAIVPQYLERPKDSAFLPYRLRADVLDHSARPAQH